jgi:hypothetical protein
MTQKKITNPATIARKLTGREPLAWHLREDGSLVVIDARGAKRHFTAAEVRKAAVSPKAEAA